ncbi:MAG: DUF2723 domain-containing protein [Chloroflexi bacterium]|nr:DUF2723 domain-containing protein [Chloroflexota bacterium]
MNYWKAKRLENGDWRLGRFFNFQSLISILLLLTVFILYVATLAQSPVLGDPTEYTFVANILGIAHPPGYAFITVLGKLFQLLVPIGAIAWRMHLLAAAAATLGLFFVYGIIHTYTQRTAHITHHASVIAALFGALIVGTSANYWQHAIHANPHIMTAVFLAANLFFLTKWWASASDKVTRWQGDKVNVTPSPRHPVTLSNKYLYAFALSAGLGVTHHPLTVMGFLAYAVFIVGVRPSILRDWKTILKMVLFALLGLSVWLYFPIRSPMEPAFGPSTMNTLNGFLDHVLARGLTESLPYFTLAEQPGRVLVFWTLLRLQYSLPVIALALVPLIWGIRQAVKDRANWRQWGQSPLSPLFLYGLTFLSFYAFVISLRAQDIMAYANGLFLLVGMMAGIGLFLVYWRLEIGDWKLPALNLQFPISNLILLLAFLAGPIWQVAQNAPRISLRDYNEGQATIDNVFSYFDGKDEGAVLLNDWEHMTPLWYVRYVDGRWPDEADVRPEFISTGGENPWLEAIFNYLPGGPVYLSSFRPGAVAGTEFRLRPAGPFYQVVEPGDTSIPSALTPLTAVGGDVEIVGYEWGDTAVTAGDYIPLTLALRAPEGTADYYVPALIVGDIRYEFTTDSHLISPNWYPGEVIVERFDFALPHDLPAGSYPVTLNLKNLSADEEYALNVPLGELQVAAQTNPPDTAGLLANFRQRMGLDKAWVWGNGRINAAPWDKNGPITVKQGDVINLVLQWESLAPAEESYTIFVHLIDAANQPWLALDYTPLGGSAPTHLWIPKWLPGQKMLDPYRLPIPADLPPGTYFIEVGLYDMTSSRRLHISDENGSLNGDRVILGTVTVIGNQ